MPVTVGDYSSSISQEFRPSDIRCLNVSSPSSGSKVTGSSVTITFRLATYVDPDLTGSVIIEYSTGGVGGPWNTASVSGSTTSLAVSQSGNDHSVTWDTITDVGSNVEQSNVLIRVTPNDGANNDGDPDVAVLSGSFTVDNLPFAPVITYPQSGWYRKDKDYPEFTVDFTIPTDPGPDKLWPVFEADTSPNFDSGSFFQVDSSEGSNYQFFDVKVINPLKPIPGYYVAGVVVGLVGNTTVSYSSLVDAYTASSLPASITDARVLVVANGDRRIMLESVSDTQVQLSSSQAGSGDNPTCDLFIFSSIQTDFYVVSNLVVPNTDLTEQTFSTMSDDFAQSIPTTFASPPRIMLCDENDRMVYVGTITTTGITFAKSVAGPDIDGQVTLFILKDNSDIYQDDDYTVTPLSLTTINWNTLDDGGALPVSIGAAVLSAVPVADRAVYMDNPVSESFDIAKSAAGIPDDALVDLNIFTETFGAGGLWVAMPSTGIDDVAYEGGEARYRAQVGDFTNTVWYFRVAFGNS